MLRNLEFRILLLIMFCITFAAAVVAALFLSLQAAVLIASTSVALITCSAVFTRWRYREIEKLSGYLRQISGGNYALDIRDNHEGELSILKSDIYKMTLMLSEQKEYLQNDKLLLTNAISDISHQLKTPLTSMMVMADLLSNPELPFEKRVEFTRNISNQLERIDWLVTSLLKLSKLDAGTVTFKENVIPIERVIQKSVEAVAIPMDIKDQTLLIEGEESVTFKGDLNWTAEAIINILKNCVEHTQKGGLITISISKNVLFTEILITDNGKGILKEDLPNIFNRFYKGRNASEDSIGIGLALAQSIIRSQNGDIEVTSKQGKGTQFLIKFYPKPVR